MLTAEDETVLGANVACAGNRFLTDRRFMKVLTGAPLRLGIVTMLPAVVKAATLSGPKKTA